MLDLEDLKMPESPCQLEGDGLDKSGAPVRLVMTAEPPRMSWPETMIAVTAQPSTVSDTRH